VFSKEGRSEAISSETGAGGAFTSFLRGIIHLSIAAMSKAALREVEDLIEALLRKFSLYLNLSSGRS
jgi:hypothetical protein